MPLFFNAEYDIVTEVMLYEDANPSTNMRLVPLS